VLGRLPLPSTVFVTTFKTSTAPVDWNPAYPEEIWAAISTPSWAALPPISAPLDKPGHSISKFIFRPF
jgi:hypothetical protein